MSICYHAIIRAAIVTFLLSYQYTSKEFELTGVHFRSLMRLGNFSRAIRCTCDLVWATSFATVFTLPSIAFIESAKV